MSTALDDREANLGDDTDEEGEPDRTDWVTCFFSGQEVHKSKALQVRLGPGRRVWMLKEFTRPG